MEYFKYMLTTYTGPYAQGPLGKLRPARRLLSATWVQASAPQLDRAWNCLPRTRSRLGRLGRLGWLGRLGQLGRLEADGVGGALLEEVLVGLSRSPRDLCRTPTGKYPDAFPVIAPFFLPGIFRDGHECANYVLEGDRPPTDTQCHYNFVGIWWDIARSGAPVGHEASI